MKACASLKKALALYTNGNLEAEERPFLVEHLRHCARCTEYLREMESISLDLTNLAAQPELKAPATLRRQIEASLLKGPQAARTFGFTAAWGTRWKFAISIFAGATAVVLLLWHQYSIGINVVPSTKETAKRNEVAEGSPATFAQYHRLAEYPAEELDAALNRTSYGADSLEQYTISSAREIGSNN
jgi:predicted anti-sigma-YlaC factor YlaD